MASPVASKDRIRGANPDTGTSPRQGHLKEGDERARYNVETAREKDEGETAWSRKRVHFW